MFFFEKKNQKTFSIALAAALALPAASAAVAAPLEVVSATLEQGGHAVRIVFKNRQSLVVPMIDTFAVEFGEPVISQDRRSVAWAEALKMNASYADVTILYVYRDGRMVTFADPSIKFPGVGGCLRGGATLDWHFLDGGRKLYHACAFPHGQPWEYRNLFDLDTGKLLGVVDVDNETGQPPKTAPEWARPPAP